MTRYHRVLGNSYSLINLTLYIPMILSVVRYRIGGGGGGGGTVNRVSTAFTTTVVEGLSLSRNNGGAVVGRRPFGTSPFLHIRTNNDLVPTSATSSLLSRPNHSNRISPPPPLLPTQTTLRSSSTEPPPPTNQEHTTTTSLRNERYVIVHRNRQSRKFRDGSPLVFGDAVSSLLNLRFGTTDPTTDPTHPAIPSGALVGIVVEGKMSSSDGGGATQKQNRGTRRRTRRSSGAKNDTNQPQPSSYQQYNLGQDDEPDGGPVRSMLVDGDLVGYGVYNPHSLYRVRILCHKHKDPSVFRAVHTLLTGAAVVDEDTTTTTTTTNDNFLEQRAIELILESHIRNAIQTRLALNLPSPSTDTYRLVNGEGDGLSGLAVDVMAGSVAVVMSSAAWVQYYQQSVITVLERVLREECPEYFAEGKGEMEIVWRVTPSRLQQDGYQEPSHTNTDNNIHNNNDEVPNHEQPVIITEHNIRYQTYPYDPTSQKTGFYTDQRDNRYNLRPYCHNKRVLDLCCYTGGFTLSAASAGATTCVGVDSSPVAIQAAATNAELNGLPSSSCDVRFVRDDIVSFCQSDTNYYDVVILDPPKLAPTVAGLDRASRKYRVLNREAIRKIDPEKGGMLLTCTCSAAMTQKIGGQFFLETVYGAAMAAKRTIRLVSVSGPSGCHTRCPASFPSGAYLTAALFYVGPLDE